MVKMQQLTETAAAKTTITEGVAGVVTGKLSALTNRKEKRSGSCFNTTVQGNQAASGDRGI